MSPRSPSPFFINPFDQEVGFLDAGSSLARSRVTTRDVDDVQRDVRQLGAERGGQIVASAFDQDPN